MQDQVKEEVSFSNQRIKYHVLRIKAASTKKKPRVTGTVASGLEPCGF